MIKRVENLAKEILFQDTDTGRFYRRVIGAVGWPWEPMPGFMVVVGEQYSYDMGLKGRPLDILAEREVESIVAIHQGCLELRKQWACDTWLADLEQNEPVRLFRQINRQQPNFVNAIWLTAAPYSQGEGRIQRLFQMLGMVQSPERKLLSYGPGSRLPGFAISLDPKDLQQPAAKFPALAALGYAVAEMILHEPWAGASMKKRVVTEWDRHNLGG